MHLRPVVRGPDARSIVDKVQRGEVEWTVADAKSGKRKAEIPAGLLAVCRKALALDSDARYRNLDALQADLLAYETGFATSAEKAGAWKQFALLIKRNKTASLGLAAVLLVGSGFRARTRRND